MRTLAPLVLVALWSIAGSGCEDDPPSDGGAGAGGGGSGGARAGTGGGGSGGAGGADGGSGGSSAAGDGGSGGAPVAGEPCDMPCEAGQVCEYVQVQCIRAPCPPLPTCVDDSGGSGGEACADQGQKCSDQTSCCDGLTCCTGVPVPAGEEYCSATCPKSDRNAKRDFAPVSSEQVLQGLKQLPITTWRYRDEPAGTAHIGPMAQDFKTTFRVGTDARYISTTDADGVALAAIKALSEQLDRLEAEQQKLRAENAALRTELDAVRAQARSAR